MKTPLRARLARTTVIKMALLACMSCGFSCASNEAASVNAADANGQTALHTAASGGHDKRVRKLLQRGASVNAQDHQGNTPLHLAAMRGHDETIRELLYLGASRTMTNKDGKTPAEVASPTVVTRVQP